MLWLVCAITSNHKLTSHTCMGDQVTSLSLGGPSTSMTWTTRATNGCAWHGLAHGNSDTWPHGSMKRRPVCLYGLTSGLHTGKWADQANKLLGVSLPWRWDPPSRCVFSYVNVHNKCIHVCQEITAWTLRQVHVIYASARFNSLESIGTEIRVCVQQGSPKIDFKTVRISKYSMDGLGLASLRS